MDEEKIKLPIHSALIPVFYQNFHCLAQDCRDSCCVDWSITFDKKDYLRLRRLDAPEELKQRLEQGVRRQRKGKHDGVLYGHFDLNANHGRCPFLDPDGLCSIQRNCGHEALPNVCTTYPRKIFYTAAAKEYTLSPSCEGVLQQLWDLPDGVAFVEDPLPKAEHRTYHAHKGENLSYCFAPLRAMCIDILQNRSMSLTQRMLCLGLILQKLQKEDWTDFDPDTWSQQSMAEVDSVAAMAMEIPGNREMYLMQNLSVLNAISLAARQGDWNMELYTALGAKREVTLEAQAENATAYNATMTTTVSRQNYKEALEGFQAAFSDREYFFENLMVASALYLGFPSLGSREELWKSYVSLCSLYSFYRFVSVVGCKEEASKERLFHVLALSSRATLHNRNRFDGFQEALFQHESSSLAHMAILLRGD